MTSLDSFIKCITKDNDGLIKCLEKFGTITKKSDYEIYINQSKSKNKDNRYIIFQDANEMIGVHEYNSQAIENFKSGMEFNMFYDYQIIIIDNKQSLDTIYDCCFKYNTKNNK